MICVGTDRYSLKVPCELSNYDWAPYGESGRVVSCERPRVLNVACGNKMYFPNCVGNWYGEDPTTLFPPTTKSYSPAICVQGISALQLRPESSPIASVTYELKYRPVSVWCNPDSTDNVNFANLGSAYDYSFRVGLQRNATRYVSHRMASSYEISTFNDEYCVDGLSSGRTDFNYWILYRFEQVNTTSASAFTPYGIWVNSDSGDSFYRLKNSDYKIWEFFYSESKTLKYVLVNFNSFFNKSVGRIYAPQLLVNPRSVFEEGFIWYSKLDVMGCGWSLWNDSLIGG